MDIMGTMDDEEEGPSSYAKFKSTNEIIPDDLEKTGPKFGQEKLDSLDEIIPFGTVVQYVQEGAGVVLIMPSDKDQIFDLDNIVCLPENAEGQPEEVSKLVVGFVSDLVGPVSMPLYSVALYKTFNQ